jgi:hypothetical protein
MNRRVSFFLLGLLFSSLSFSEQQSPTVQRLIGVKNAESRRGSREEADLDTLSRTIYRVERAFESGNSEELDECLAEKRIYLSLKSRGEEAGYYGKSQVKAMLAKLFRERKTDSFTYDPGQVEVEGGENAAFRAEWSYVGPEEDDVVTEELRFRLDRGKGARGDDWRVSEIRAQSR